MSELKLAFNKRTHKNHLVKASGDSVEFDYGALAESIRLDKLRNLSDLSIPTNNPNFVGSSANSVQNILKKLSSPDQISGLVVWYETGEYDNILCYEDGTIPPNNPCEDNEVCLLWKDQKNSFHLKEATNGLTYQGPNGGDADVPGGKGRLVADGVNDVLIETTVANWKFLHNGGGGTLIVVCKTTNEVNAVIADTTNALTGIGFYLANDDASTAEGRATLAIRNASGNILVAQANLTANVFPVAAWHSIEGNWITGNNGEVWVDGCKVASTAASGSASTADSAEALNIGKSGATFYANSYAGIFAYNKVLTVAERRKIMAYIGIRYAIPVFNIACLGDSITSLGISSSAWSTKLVNLLGPLWSTTNKGVSGAVVNDAAGTDIYNDQWLHTTNGVKSQRYNWVTVLGGINDIRNYTDSAATIFARLKTMLDEIVAETDMRMLLCSILPWKDTTVGTGWTATKQATTLAYNELIRQYVIDNSSRVFFIDMYTLMGSPNDSARMRTEYDNDNLHPNQLGSDVMATAFADALFQIDWF